MEGANFIAHNPGRKGKLKEMRSATSWRGFLRDSSLTIECLDHIIDPCDGYFMAGVKKVLKARTLRKTCHWWEDMKMGGRSEFYHFVK
ncbi:hypothetical protein CDAR_26241 [Caerostris darwini]|uniref:Uncharacterized protein n=1 Tax=Caerostris darwini TaxID=1538125 RepID=A0AAV4N9Q9_9ARAC|nr:hypothetical protein CDAR_26241 [Caerostris darwini]